MNIGELIRNLRKERKIGQNELARRANVPPGYLCALETGKKANPTFSVILKLTKALDLNHDETSALIFLLNDEGITLDPMQKDHFLQNQFHFHKDKMRYLQDLCLDRITTTLILNAQYITNEDLIFIADHVEQFVGYLKTKTPKINISITKGDEE